MDDDRYLYSPIGLMFITMGEYHEQVSFAYPFDAYQTSSEFSTVSYNPSESQQSVSAERSQSHYSVPTKILAHLLSARGIRDKPIEIKIDNIRFAGFPKTVSNPTGRSPQTFHVVFILMANAPAHLISSFQELSLKIAIAIDEEQSRCGYLADQMSTMLNEHDKTDTLPDGNLFPYREILVHSSLAQDLRDIFEDISEYGVMHVFLNNCIEIGFCVEPRALLHAGLTPKTRAEIEATIRRIRPYHGILLLDDAMPSPNFNPALQLFLRHCEPDQSLIGISNSSGLPLFQVLLIVRHLLLWIRAVVIYPLCSSNIYTSATSPKPLNRLTEQFAEVFENAYLPTILAQFSPPCSLADFINPSLYEIKEQHTRVRMVAMLLRDELIMQLHMFIYVLPPFSDDDVTLSELENLEVVNLREFIKAFELSDTIKASIANVCNKLLQTNTEGQVEGLLHLFRRLMPFLNGEHHIEDMMYRLNMERSAIVRVLDTFSCILSPFVRPDYV